MANMGTGASLPLGSGEVMIARLEVESCFPNIYKAFEVTSLCTEEYNCIAWAADDTERWWWPTNPDQYWPDGADRNETIEAFAKAFETLGYSACDDGRLEDGMEKVAIYCINGIPKHMARQLPSGVWTSKLGSRWDISHYVAEGVNGLIYGSPVYFLSRNSASYVRNSVP